MQLKPSQGREQRYSKAEYIDLIEADMIEKLLSIEYSDCIEYETKEYIAGMLFRTYKECAEIYYKTNIEKRKFIMC